MEKEKFSFKLKKSNKMIGDFDTTDPNEWTLLVKEVYQEFSQFIHYRKLWLIEEREEIQEDSENGIEYQFPIKRAPACICYRGFIKDGAHVVTSSHTMSGKDFDSVNKTFLKHLEACHVDSGYKKEVAMYNDGIALCPKYHSNIDDNSGSLVGPRTSTMRPHILLGKAANSNRGNVITK
jgi:hypothetical protein